MKKGISLVSLTVVIIVLVILAGIVVIKGIDSAKIATVNQFAIEMLNIQTAVDEYHYRNNKYPVTTDIVFSTANINESSLNQFDSENIVDNQITLKLIDLSLIGIKDSEFGKNEGEQDVYALSDTTGKIYYLAGIEYKGKIYYCLTNELYEDFDITSNRKVNATDIKKYDVVFTASSVEYTNVPITVDVKIPKEATFDLVATTNSKSVSEEEIIGEYKVIKVNQTGDNKNGNYQITVKYTYNQVQKTVTYVVDTFDNTSPKLETYEQYGDTTTVVTINASDTQSGIKQIKYETSKIKNSEYFKHYGKIVNGNRVVINNKDTYTIYVEDKAGNTSIVTMSGLLNELESNITAIVDEVPIPKGFVASGATGENTKAKGLVIYEGTEAVTDANVDGARTSRNQYVWVPVDTATFETTFVRKNFGWAYTISSTIGTNCWEVLPTTELTTDNLKYMTEDTLKEVQAMYASVKKYGGFYIARYEAGIDTQRTEQGTSGADLPGIKEGTKVYSVMGKIPYTYVPWTWNKAMNEDTNGAVEIARRIYPESNTNYGVVSTLTYGVQWDRTVQWFIDTKVMTLDQVTRTEGSTAFGNYSDHVIKEGDLNPGAKYAVHNSSNLSSYQDVSYGADGKSTTTKASGKEWALSTGALKAANINNIYDMAGNMTEMTMEGEASGSHFNRGDYFFSTGAVASRGYYGNPSYSNEVLGFRPSLYIK